MYVVFNYILRQTPIAKTHDTLFLHFISIIINPEDMYYENISDLSDSDLEAYFSHIARHSESPPDSSLFSDLLFRPPSHQKFLRISQNLQDLFQEIKKSTYIYVEHQALDKLLAILQSLQEELDVSMRNS